VVRSLFKGKYKGFKFWLNAGIVYIKCHFGARIFVARELQNTPGTIPVSIIYLGKFI